MLCIKGTEIDERNFCSQDVSVGYERQTCKQLYSTRNISAVELDYQVQ